MRSFSPSSGRANSLSLNVKIGVLYVILRLLLKTCNPADWQPACVHGELLREELLRELPRCDYTAHPLAAVMV